MLQATPLTEGWILRHSDGTVDELPAVVPGCVHTDLLAAGVIPDPFLGRNETEVAWVGRRDWTYETDLGLMNGHEQTDLAFDGLDTVAEILLDGRLLGRTRNMHRSYRFDVTGMSGRLAVRFVSAYAEAEAVRGKLGERPAAYAEPYQYLRKMACSFGWDWGPTLVTAGIWRPVRLERWSTARIARVRPLATVEQGVGVVELAVDVERARVEAPLTVEATVGGERVRASVDGTQGVVRLEVPRARLWWPRGYGEQPLYDVELMLLHEGRPLDVWRRRVGFRTVELDRSADAHGTGFTLVVNGERLFARGVNWIPDDVFPSRITRERYRERLGQAAGAGVDLVRIWGGGIYESEDFYDACDELGLLVWQDFPFACAAYPEEQPLRGEVEAEARENVVRLMPHPSLVLWNGNNENLWGFRDWGWEARLAGDSWGEGYYLGVLPRVVAELDPTRPYTAGSPWSGSWEHHPNDPAHGTHHSWEVWNREDYAEYRGEVPRFVAEFGWQAPPAYATLARALPGEVLAADSPGMLHHQKADDGNGKLRRGLERHFAFPEGDFDRWHYLMQVNQARAVAAGIEHWRSHWPVCAGTVVWQLNDCWPVTSWAAIDGDGREKPLYHELRRLYADRLLTVQMRGQKLVLAAVNQAGEPWAGVLRLRRMSVDGEVIDEAELDFRADRRTVTDVTVPPELVPVGPKEFLVADAGGDGGLDRGAGAGMGRGSAAGAGAGAGTEVSAAPSAGTGRGSEAGAGASQDAGASVGEDAAAGTGRGSAAGGGTRTEVGAATEAGMGRDSEAGAGTGRDPGAEAGAGGAQGSGTRTGGVRALYFPSPDREIPYPRPEFDVAVAPGAVTVTARTLVRDLLLQADRLDPAARADRGLVTLLPGERVTIGVGGWETPDPDAARSALYCLEPSR
ncbi:glycoside hydrolase family 2 protein [Streptomyces canus]|uniref:glycosyl hydrolase 2 galactose-binding domain-containing protein n=1 Tax=Streptomyces canus TaxID=58343 RepID=UPI00225857BE|nr:glycoside hydrolase family 2 protein [Streptomyces canus]MCX5252726.1 glycoside hydrolase family 2 protein [Streptomyces canus]